MVMSFQVFCKIAGSNNTFSYIGEIYIKNLSRFYIKYLFKKPGALWGRRKLMEDVNIFQ